MLAFKFEPLANRRALYLVGLFLIQDSDLVRYLRSHGYYATGTVFSNNQYKSKFRGGNRIAYQSIEKLQQDVPGTLSQPVAIVFMEGQMVLQSSVIR
jgi:hypothetical protein